MEFLDILGFLANVSALMFFISPLLMMIELAKTKETKKIPYFIFVGAILNCLFWLIYGIQKNLWPVYFCNGVGLFLNNVFLIMFIFYVQEINALLRIIINVFIISFNALMIFIFLLFVQNTSIAGSIAMGFNIIMFVATLQKIIEVFQFKDNSYIPFSTIVSLLICTSLWTLYGIFQKDLYLVVPNGIGLVLALFQFVLWFIFNNPVKTAEDAKEKTEEKPLISN